MDVCLGATGAETLAGNRRRGGKDGWTDRCERMSVEDGEEQRSFHKYLKNVLKLPINHVPAGDSCVETVYVYIALSGLVEIAARLGISVDDTKILSHKLNVKKLRYDIDIVWGLLPQAELFGKWGMSPHGSRRSFA